MLSCPPYGLGNDMIDMVIVIREMNATAVADAFLQSIQQRLVGLIRRQIAQVIARRDILARDHFRQLPPTQQRARIGGFLSRRSRNQSRCQRTQINTHPTTPKTLRGITGRSTAAERIKNNIALITAGRDDSLIKSKGFVLGSPFPLAMTIARPC